MTRTKGIAADICIQEQIAVGRIASRWQQTCILSRALTYPPLFPLGMAGNEFADTTGAGSAAVIATRIAAQVFGCLISGRIT